MAVKNNIPVSNNRLTVVGPVTALNGFDENVSLEAELGARYLEPLERRTTRLVWQFESDTPPLEPMKRLSACHPRLTLLLDYDWERRKGLAKAKSGQLERHEVSY